MGHWQKAVSRRNSIKPNNENYIEILESAVKFGILLAARGIAPLYLLSLPYSYRTKIVHLDALPNILMAAVGGIMIPTFFMPSVMQTLSRGSPMNWALEGLLKVLLRGGNLHGVQHEATLLLALAAVSLSLAYLVLRLKRM